MSAIETSVNPAFPIPGTALHLACGVGRHSLWLAGKGGKVTAVDISDVAIEKLNLAAIENDVEVDFVVADLALIKFETLKFDLIVLYYHEDRSMYSKIIKSLKSVGF